MQQQNRKIQPTKFYRPSRARKQNSARILARFVELANLLDPDEQVPEPWEMRRMPSDGKLWEFHRKFHRLLPPMRRKVFFRRYPNGVDENGNAVSCSPIIEADGRVDCRLVDYPFSLLATGSPGSEQASGFDGSYELFYTVRRALEELVKANSEERTGSIWIPCGYRRFDRKSDGSIERVEDAFNDAFLPALVDGDPSRIRRCPVCHMFYWANPRHKMACDEHLALARVWRSRGKLLGYEQNRRINRLVKRGAPIGEATKRVKGEERS